MSVPASRVRSVCTAAEVKLVRASRRPEVQRLTPAELRRYAAQARKLMDKWQAQSRRQSRSQQSGEEGQNSTNTSLKEQIFREAVESFELHLATQTARGTHPGDKARPPMAKKKRAASHRRSRTTARLGLASTENELNSPPGQRRKAKSTKPKIKSESSSARVNVAEFELPEGEKASKASKESKTKKAAKRASRTNAATSAKSKKKTPALAEALAKQLPAAIAAKKSRLVRSGQKTRMAGHALARGQRSQARRDKRR